MHHFAPGGCLESCIPGYEQRETQVRMAGAVWEAIQTKSHLLIEAGTGVGKTLAYLVPLLDMEEQAVISTATRVLQHQLKEKDIPLGEAALGRTPQVTLLKGRGNYLCKLRLEQLQINPLFESTDEIPAWQIVKAWAPHTETGDFEEISDFNAGHPLLQRINADRNYCTGSRCPHFDSCHFYQLRRQAMQSDLVLVNHHLLCSDLSVRETLYGAILPPHPVLIVDEAHRLEDIASGQFGELLTPRMISVLLAQVPTEIKVRHSSHLKDQLTMSGVLPEGPFRRMPIRGKLQEQLADLGPLLESLKNDISGLNSREFELKDNVLQRLNGFESFLHSVDDQDMVSFVERENGNLTFRSVPVDISPRIEQALSGHFETVVMTSATLSVGGNLEFFRNRVGLQEARGEVLSSPFPYAEHTRLFVPGKKLDVNSPEFVRNAVEILIPILEKLNGRTFILCTSRRNVTLFSDALKEGTSLNVLTQGEGSPAGLVGRFQLEPRSVLIGSYSFWEGIDVKGDALTCVVIDRLPFPQPDEPVFRARSERMDESFFGYSVPLAVLQFKQGLGRLIRSHTDRGLYVVLDSRLVSRRYGQVFLDSFYRLPVLKTIPELEKYLADL